MANNYFPSENYVDETHELRQTCTKISVCVCVWCVCGVWCVVCVCVCVCVCVHFLSPLRLLLTEQNNKCNARVQVSDVMLRK